MDVEQKLKSILDETLNLGGRSSSWNSETELLGGVPELTSIAVLNVLLAIEENFNIVIADDEMDADNFMTIGSLARFIESKTR